MECTAPRNRPRAPAVRFRLDWLPASHESVRIPKGHTVTLRPSRLLRSAPSALLLGGLLAASPALGQDKVPAAPAPVAPAATPPAAAAALPDAKSIIEKSVAVIGGRELWMKRTSMEMTGTIEMPAQGIKGTILSRTAQPNKMTTTLEMPGLGAFRTGFDGKTGWASDKIQGTRLMQGKELETIAREADYMKDVDPLRRWDKVETIGEGAFGAYDCWKIRATKGEEKSVLWYEKSTGLARGFEMTIDTQLGKLPVVTTFVEYRDFDGLKLPVRTEATQAGQKIITTYESVKFDTATAAQFELPAEIKALLEPEPAEDEDGEDGEDGAQAPKTPVAPKTPETPKAPESPKVPASPKR
jgi:hypothetical protein